MSDFTSRAGWKKRKKEKMTTFFSRDFDRHGERNTKPPMIV
jgi:hypothetical protein